MIKKLLWILSPLIGWIFTYMSFLIPVTRLRETSNLLAFHHPSPGYKFHVLIVPKRQVDSLARLDPQEDTAFLTDLYATVQSLVDEFQLKAYRLIVNGGEYQDFPHLHFHLISQPLSPGERGRGEGL
ncbi:MAG: HIT domain-containing protein [Chloroflexi bacterium]|nr:HIT domain-containing protein [Chloroflexota bacterium]